MNFTAFDGIPFQTKLDLVRLIRNMGRLTNDFYLDLEIVTTEFDKLIRYKGWKFPLVMRGDDGKEYMGDSRYLGTIDVDFVQVLTQRGSKMYVLEGSSGREIDVEQPGPILPRRRSAVQGEWYFLDLIIGIYRCTLEPSSSDEEPFSERSFEMIETDRFTSERDAVLGCKSPQRSVIRFLAGLAKGRAVCKVCDFVVVVDGHTSKCETKVKTVDIPDKSKLQRDALRGDLLMKYHFLTIAEGCDMPQAYTAISRLFSNFHQRRFLSRPGEIPVQVKYGLLVTSSDHTWGTAVEAEYQNDCSFRERYMKWVFSEIGVNTDGNFQKWLDVDVKAMKVVE